MSSLESAGAYSNENKGSSESNCMVRRLDVKKVVLVSEVELVPKRVRGSRVAVNSEVGIVWHREV